MIALDNEYRPLSLRAGQTQIAKELRIRVRGQANMTLLPDLFLIDVYNLTDDDMATISLSETLSADDEKGALLCYGEIEDIYSHVEGSNTITTIVLVDGKKFWNQNVSKTIGSGSSVRDALQNILGGGVLGYFSSSDVRMIRGQTFSGKLPDAVSMLAKTVNSRAFYTHGAVYVVQKNQAWNILTIEEDDVIDDPSHAEGVLFLRVKVAGYSVGTIFHYNSHLYRLVSQKIDADNKSGPWRTELTLVDEESLSAYGMEGG